MNVPPSRHRLRVRAVVRPVPRAGVIGSIWVLLVLFAAGAASPLAGQTAAPLTLSLEEAIQRALVNNPSVLVPRAEENTALWNVRAARASLLPSASIGGGVSWQGSGEERVGSFTSGELGVVDPPSWYFSQYGASLSYSLSGSALLAPRQARAGLAAAEARTSAASTQLRLEVTRTYLDVLRRDEAVRLAEAEIERAQANVRLADAQVSVGSATELDLRQAELAVGRARVTLLRGEGEARNARIALLLLLGEEPGPGEVELTTQFPLEAPDLDEEALVDQALASNPDLARLRAQEEQARISVRSAQSSYLPTLSAQLGWSGFTRQASDDNALIAQAEASFEGQRQQCEFQNELFSRLADPLPLQNCSAIALDQAAREAIRQDNRAFPFDFTRQPPSAGLSISIPIFQGLQRQRQIEQAQVSLQSARLQEEERTRSLRGDVARGITGVRTALAAARIEEENLEVARAQLYLAREEYQAGLVDFLQLAEAESVLARGEREFLAAVFAIHDALASLEALVGRSLIQY